MYAILADRAQQSLGESAVTAATDHEQIRAGRDVQQCLRRMPVDDQAPDPLAGLSKQERKILELIGEGLTNRQIGERPGSPSRRR